MDEHVRQLGYIQRRAIPLEKVDGQTVFNAACKVLCIWCRKGLEVHVGRPFGSSYDWGHYPDGAEVRCDAAELRRGIDRYLISSAT